MRKAGGVSITTKLEDEPEDSDEEPISEAEIAELLAAGRAIAALHCETATTTG